MTYKPVASPSPTTQSGGYKPVAPTTSGYKPVLPVDAHGVAETATSEPGNTGVGGFFKNLLAGVSGAVQGVGELIGGGVQDVVGNVQKLDFVPGLGGEQSLEQRLETEGSQLNEDVLNMIGWGDRTSLVLEDLKTRYGPLLKGDFESFANEMYRQPLSFALDATLVAGAVGTPFKAAELARATTAAATTQGLSFSAARAAQIAGRTGMTRAILGPGSELFGSSVSTNLTRVRLSSNPLIRNLFQEPFLKVASEPLVKAAARAVPGTRDFALVTEGLAKSAAMGTSRAFNPIVAKIVERRGVGLLIGARRAKLSERAMAAVDELNRDWLYGSKALKSGEISMAEVVEAIQGSFDPGLPGNVPLDLTTPYDLASNDVVPTLTPIANDVQLKMYDRLTKGLGYPNEKEPFRGVRRGEVDAPHGTTPGARFSVRVGDMGQAVPTLEKAMEILNGVNLRIKNYMGDVGWKGIHGFIDTPDGTVEISVTTAKMARAQEMASKLFVRRDSAVAKALELMREAQEALKTGKTRAATNLILKAEWWEKEAAALKAYADTAFEAPVREYLANNKGAYYHPAQAIADEQRLWTYRHMTDGELDHALTGQDIMNRAYGPQRLAVFKEQLATLQNQIEGAFRMYGPQYASQGLAQVLAQFPEDSIRGLVGSLPKYVSPRQYATAITDWMRTHFRESVVSGNFPGFTWEEMHAARQAAGLPTPSYYPHIRVSDAPVSELMSTNGKSMRSAEPAHIKKHWMGYIEEEGTLIINDPVEVYARVASNIAKHQELIRYFDQVSTTYGRLVPQDELNIWKATKQGAEVLYNPEGVKAEIGLRSLIEQETADNLISGMSLERATTKAIEDLLPEIQQHSILASKGKLYALPRHVASQIAKDMRRHIGWKSRIFWDGPMALWRSSVLAFTPRWIVNNTIGNIVFTSLKDPRAMFYAIRQLGRRQRALMEFMIGKEKLADIERGFAHAIPTATRRMPDEALLEHPGLAKASEIVKESIPFRAGHTVSHFMRGVNSYIEEAWRRGVYLSAAEKSNIASFSTSFGRSKVLMQRLAKEGISDADHLAAIKSVDAVLGNYTALSPVEQDIIRRWMAPFYPFYRHTVNYTLRMPFQHPLKAQLLNQFAQLDKDFDQYLPEWLQSGVVVGEIGDGLPMFLNFQNANPLTAAVDLFGAAGGRSGPINLINPAAKLVIERLLGKDIFRDSDFSKEGVIETSDGSKWQLGPDGQPELIEGHVLPPVWRHIAMAFPQFTLFEKLMAEVSGPGLGAQYTATGNVITEGGVPKYPTEPYTMFTGYLGAPLFGFDYESYRARQAQAAQEALSRLQGMNP